MKTVDLKKSDVQSLVELYSSDFSDGWTESMLISAFDTGRFFVKGAETDGKLIGAINCTLTIDEADLEGIFVLEAYRNQKVASTLFDEMEKLLLSQGVKKMFLEVRESNLPAISFYLKKGFNKISVRKKYYQDGEDAIVMSKEY